MAAQPLSHHTATAVEIGKVSRPGRETKCLALLAVLGATQQLIEDVI